jgi:hypothetical protein
MCVSPVIRAARACPCVFLVVSLHSLLASHCLSKRGSLRVCRNCLGGVSWHRCASCQLLESHCLASATLAGAVASLPRGEDELVIDRGYKQKTQNSLTIFSVDPRGDRGRRGVLVRPARVLLTLCAWLQTWGRPPSSLGWQMACGR